MLAFPIGSILKLYLKADIECCTDATKSEIKVPIVVYMQEDRASINSNATVQKITLYATGVFYYRFSQ